MFDSLEGLFLGIAVSFAAGGRVLDDQLGPLGDDVVFGDVKVPAVAAGVDKDPAVVGLAVGPGLDGVGDLEDDFGRVGGDLAEGEAVLVPRRLQAVGRHATDQAVPGRTAVPVHQHAVQVDGVPLVEGADDQPRRVDG